MRTNRPILLPPRGVDLASRVTLARFALRILLLGVVVALALVRHRPVALAPILELAALWCVAAALLRREKIAALSLNHWDEAAAFSGLAALSRFSG
jgi:hypothetical protein